MIKRLTIFLSVSLLIFSSFVYADDTDVYMPYVPSVSVINKLKNPNNDPNFVPYKHLIVYRYKSPEGFKIKIVATKGNGFKVANNGTITTIEGDSYFEYFYFAQNQDGSYRVSPSGGAGYDNRSFVNYNDGLLFGTGLYSVDGQPMDSPTPNVGGGSGGDVPPVIPGTLANLGQAVVFSVKSLAQLGVYLMGLVLFVLLLPHLLKKFLIYFNF